MQKILTLDGFGFRGDPRDHFVKKRNFKCDGVRYDSKTHVGVKIDPRMTPGPV